LLGLTVAGVGFVILPRKRAQAKTDLRTKVRDTRDRLREVLLREHGLEGERAQGRLRDAIAPYTRFIRSENERLGASQAKLEGLKAQASSLRNEVEAM
jgi:hypothetical protein